MWPVRLFSVCLGLVHFNPQTESSLYEYNICKYFFIVPLAVLYIIRMCGKISIISIYIISLVCNWIRYCRSYHKYKNIRTGEYYLQGDEGEMFEWKKFQSTEKIELFSSE